MPIPASTAPDIDYLQSLGKESLIALLLDKQLASSEPMEVKAETGLVKAETGAEGGEESEED